MHGVMGKPPGAAQDNNIATSKVMLLMLVVMTGVAPISLYMLVPALPVLATDFGRDISIAQMTVSLYMVGIACSQLIMGPLSDKEVCLKSFCSRMRELIPEARQEHRPAPGWSQK